MRRAHPLDPPMIYQQIDTIHKGTEPAPEDSDIYSFCEIKIIFAEHLRFEHRPI